MSLRPRAAIAPIPLLLLFGAFLAAIVYLVAASLTRRDAPVFPISPRERTRATNWERVGDMLTVDATDGERWQYVSLESGRVLKQHDKAGGGGAGYTVSPLTPNCDWSAIHMM